MKKVLFIIVIILLGLLLWRFGSGAEDTWLCEDGQWVTHGNPNSAKPDHGCGKSPAPSPALPVQEAITLQLADKYDRSPSEIELTVDATENGYAKGSVRFAGEMGGALWFGAQRDLSWVLVHDGQGPVSCQVAEHYQLPYDFAPKCLTDAGQLESR